MGDPLVQARPWFERHPIQRRPTEILVPLCLSVAPIWDHVRNVGGFAASVDIALSFDELESDEFNTEPFPPAVECEHIHPTADGAWKCADRLGRRVAEHVIANRRRTKTGSNQGGES
jgi:hypothetical protein